MNFLAPNHPESGPIQMTHAAANQSEVGAANAEAGAANSTETKGQESGGHTVNNANPPKKRGCSAGRRNDGDRCVGRGIVSSLLCSLGYLSESADGAAKNSNKQLSDAANQQKSGDSRNTGVKMGVEMEETQLGRPNSFSPATSNRTMSFTYPPGSKPLPPYTIRRGVGVGGFGEVYFAVSQAGKEVALKRIQRNLDIELRGVSQCLNLKHPNLVSLFDICKDSDGGSWVVMEYVSGKNLREILDQNPEGLPESEVRHWISGVAAGVDHLHNAGLVHRDIKPGNIFDDLGIIKVGDYGLSKFISSSQRGGHTESVGTFHYMAPEIGRGQYGREIDVYALGVMLYELLTGQVPFDGESCHEIIVKHMTALPDLSKVASPYREVIARALDKDPARRPSNISDWIAPLGLSTTGAPAIQTSPAPTQPRREIPVPQQATPLSFVSASASNNAVPNGAVPNSAVPNGAVRNGAVRNGAAKSSPYPDVVGPDMLVTPEGDSSPRNSDEPLLRALRTTSGQLWSWWRSMDQSPRAKFWLGAFIAFVLFVNTHWLLPALSILGAVYVPYYIIRQMVLHNTEQPSYARAHQLASQAPPPPRPKSKAEWRSEVRHTLKAKPSLVRMAELNTSWIASSLTVLALAVAGGIIGLRSGEVTPLALAPYFWIGIVVLVGTHGILGLGKLWERDEGEGLPRRLVLAGVGAGVGMVAFAGREFFMLSEVPAGSDFLGGDLPQALYEPNGDIRAAGMMAHFAVLLGAIRWWKPVDPLRRTRLSLWSVAVTCVAAWGVHQILPVPQPFGVLVAGGLAIATQMSAPWINPRLIDVAPDPNPSLMANRKPHSPHGVSA